MKSRMLINAFSKMMKSSTSGISRCKPFTYPDTHRITWVIRSEVRGSILDNNVLILLRD